MGNVQSRSNLSNVPFTRHGEHLVRDGKTLLQDAGKTVDQATYTVLGLVKSAVPATGTADVGNTGDGTVTAVAKLADGKAARVGAYNLECIGAVANGGVFKLEGPGGELISNNIVMTPGVGAATIFEVGGFTFTITDGAADFIVGDKFAITVTAVGKYIPLDPSNVNGGAQFAGLQMNGDIPVATIVAGDYTDLRLIYGGDDLIIDENQLVFDADVTPAVTLGTILPSGKTVEEEMNAVGIFTTATINIDEFENA